MPDLLYVHSASAYVITKYCTHVYSYIIDDTVDVWDGGMEPTFGLRLVYMSILMLWFSNREVCTHFDCTFWVCMHEKPTKYKIMYTYTSYYIYEWSFLYVCNDLKSFKLSAFFKSNTFGSHYATTRLLTCMLVGSGDITVSIWVSVLKWLWRPFIYTHSERKKASLLCKCVLSILILVMAL